MREVHRIDCLRSIALSLKVCIARIREQGVRPALFELHTMTGRGVAGCYDRRMTSVRISLVLVLTGVSLFADNWPAWRGPAGTGVSMDKGLPVKWSTTKNIKWKASLPERGNSSPIVWGDKVFVTQAIEQVGRRMLLCLNRKNGRELWRSSVLFRENELTHRTNPYCSASPATDGERVVVSHGSAGIVCYDMDGKELWRRELGVQRHIWGNAASPVIYKDLVILNHGPGDPTFLVALNKANGTEVWRHDELGGDSGVKKDGQRGKWIGSWTTPIVLSVNGRDQLLMSYPGRLVAFEPANGKEVWSCGGLNSLVYTSPIFDEGIAVAMGGYGGTALAARLGGKGDVTKTHRLWTRPKEQQRIGSGVMHEGHVYIQNATGVAQCINVKSGKVVWEERLKGKGARGGSWSSMVLAGGRLYAMNQSADVFVLKAAPKFELVATNSLGETTQSSIAVSGGELFIRTYNHLWCISGE